MVMMTRSKCTKTTAEILLSYPTSTAHHSAFRTLAVQCAICFKWRIIPTEEEYERIRSKITKQPFFCSRKPNVSCDHPADIEYGPHQHWAIDHPNIPVTPAGFKRAYTKKTKKFEPYYIAPTGKKLRTIAELTSFLNANPEFNDLSAENFSFAAPNIEPPKHVELDED